MEEATDSQAHQSAVLSEDPVTGEEQEPNNANNSSNHGDVLTIRQTDDQEMGLAVAILELIGSQPHVQVTVPSCIIGLVCY